MVLKKSKAGFLEMIEGGSKVSRRGVIELPWKC